MKSLPLFLVLAPLAAAVPALAQNAPPSCPKDAGAGQSTNWGPNYDLYVQEIFELAKDKAGITQPVRLISTQFRTIEGSPISALPKGTQVRDGALPTDTVVYGFGLFEIACDQAQLATFMLHEMRHIKPDENGKTHFQKVADCRKEMLQTWAAGTDLSAYPNPKAEIDDFLVKKANEIQTKCVLPVEKEADDFAFATLPKMGLQMSNGPDPFGDARSKSFQNADKWAQATNVNGCDPGHGCLADRAKAGAKVAAGEIKARQDAQAAQQAAQDRIDMMSHVRPDGN